jgi:tRNA (adenine22-N1)-methyltransferase
MTLSKRLETVASFVDKGASIADVGSDHAELPIFLFDQGAINFAEAIENKPGPYSVMEKALSHSGFLSHCRLSLSDGVAELDPQVDTVVLAGMGGPLIVRILNSHKEKLGHVKTIIVDAHSERPLVIGALAALGYRLSDNAFFFEADIAYDVMKWQRSPVAVAYSPKERLFGPLNLLRKPAAWVAYWSKERERLLALVQKPALPASGKAAYEMKIAQITGAIG